MNATMTLESGMRFIGSSDSGFSVALDSSPAVGGNDSGFRPMELMLLSVCSCTAMDVLSILRKKRQIVSGLQVQAQAKTAETYPKVFTEIQLEYIITGQDIKPAAVERAIQLSAEVYCPAQAMAAQTAEITHSYTIVEEPQP